MATPKAPRERNRNSFRPRLRILPARPPVSSEGSRRRASGPSLLSCSSRERQYPRQGNTKAEQQAADQKLQTGVKQYLTSPVTVGGTPFTATQLGTVIQGRIDARIAVDVAGATFHSKVAAQAASIEGSKVLLAQAKAVLLVMFASSPEVLVAMGLSEKKKPVISVEDKAAAIEKGLATRKARHTMGPKARLDVTGVTAAAATAGAAPAVSVVPVAAGKATS